MYRFPAGLCFLCIFFISCKTPRYIYFPARINAPLLKEKNDFQGDVSLATGPGMDLSAAFAPLNHVGILVNAGWSWDKQSGNGQTRELLSPFSIQYKQKNLEAACGYFTTIGYRKSWVVEAYTGIGTGTLQISDNGKANDSLRSAYERNYRCRIGRWYFQPGFGFSSRYFQAAFFLRLLFLRYHDIQTNYNPAERDYYKIPSPLSKNINLWETGSCFRFYFPDFEQLGLEFSMVFSLPSGTRTYDIYPIQASAGLNFRLDRHLSGKNK